MSDGSYRGSKTQPTWIREYERTVTISQASIGVDDFDLDISEVLDLADWLNGQKARVIEGVVVAEGTPLTVLDCTTRNITFGEKVGSNGLDIRTGDRLAITQFGMPPQDAAGGITNLFGEIESAPIPRPAREYLDKWYHGSEHMPARDRAIPIKITYGADIEFDVLSAEILSMGFGNISDDTADFDGAGINTTFSIDLYPGQDEVPCAAYTNFTTGDLVHIAGGTNVALDAGKPEIRAIDYVYEIVAFTLGGAVGGLEVLPGATVTGSVSAETAVVIRTELASGSWAAGTAAGDLILRSVSGVLVAENLASDAVGNETVAIAADSIAAAFHLTKPLYNMHYSNASNDVKEVNHTAGVPDTVVTHLLDISEDMPTFASEHTFIASRKYTGSDIVHQSLGLICTSIGLRSSPGSNPLQCGLTVQGLHSRRAQADGTEITERSSVVEVGFDKGVWKYSKSTVSVNGVGYGEAQDFTATHSIEVNTKNVHTDGSHLYYKEGDPMVHYEGKVTAEYTLTLPLQNTNMMVLLEQGTAFTATFLFERGSVGEEFLITFTKCYIKGPDVELPEPGEIPYTGDATARKMTLTIKDFLGHY